MGQQQILLLVVSVIIVVLAITIGIEMFATNSKTSNRDSVVSELNNLATLAIQFYKKPASYGGGNSSFISWNIPEKMDSTSNGIYSVACTNLNVTITGFGQEVGNDGANPIEMVAVVTSASIVISVVN
jgi:Tfp pilus assembly protein PilE